MFAESGIRSLKLWLSGVFGSIVITTYTPIMVL